MHTHPIEASLEAVARHLGDPTAQVYARLFEREPALRALFVRDTDGSVRGQMLQQVIETVLDLAGDDRYASVLIGTEWVNHQNLGVPGEQFSLFFTAMIETFRVELGEAWTPEFDAAWEAVLSRVTEIVAARAASA
jgi:hemoglobin-like flavoprotein